MIAGVAQEQQQEDPPAVPGLCVTQGDVIIFWIGNIQFNIQVP